MLFTSQEQLTFQHHRQKSNHKVNIIEKGFRLTFILPSPIIKKTVIYTYSDRNMNKSIYSNTPYIRRPLVNNLTLHQLNP